MALLLPRQQHLARRAGGGRAVNAADPCLAPALLAPAPAVACGQWPPLPGGISRRQAPLPAARGPTVTPSNAVASTPPAPPARPARPTATLQQVAATPPADGGAGRAQARFLIPGAAALERPPKCLKLAARRRLAAGGRVPGGRAGAPNSTPQGGGRLLPCGRCGRPRGSPGRTPTAARPGGHGRPPRCRCSRPRGSPAGAAIAALPGCRRRPPHRKSSCPRDSPAGVPTAAQPGGRCLRPRCMSTHPRGSPGRAATSGGEGGRLQPHGHTSTRPRGAPPGAATAGPPCADQRLPGRASQAHPSGGPAAGRATPRSTRPRHAGRQRGHRQCGLPIQNRISGPRGGMEAPAAASGPAEGRGAEGWWMGMLAGGGQAEVFAGCARAGMRAGDGGARKPHGGQAGAPGRAAPCRAACRCGASWSLKFRSPQKGLAWEACSWVLKPILVRWLVTSAPGGAGCKQAGGQAGRQSGVRARRCRVQGGLARPGGAGTVGTKEGRAFGGRGACRRRQTERGCGSVEGGGGSDAAGDAPLEAVPAAPATGGHSERRTRSAAGARRRVRPRGWRARGGVGRRAFLRALCAARAARAARAVQRCAVCTPRPSHHEHALDVQHRHERAKHDQRRQDGAAGDEAEPAGLVLQTAMEVHPEEAGNLPGGIGGGVGWGGVGWGGVGWGGVGWGGVGWGGVGWGGWGGVGWGGVGWGGVGWGGVGWGGWVSSGVEGEAGGAIVGLR
jgi:hypothetical protein